MVYLILELQKHIHYLAVISNLHISFEFEPVDHELSPLVSNYHILFLSGDSLYSEPADSRASQHHAPLQEVYSQVPGDREVVWHTVLL